MGTVHISFLNTAMKGTLSLVNSNKYQLTSLTSTHDHYTGSYPANGDMMLVYNDSNAQNHNTAAFKAEWECEDTSVVPPAQGFDSSDYLTLPQEGTYMRLFSERALYKWIIPCRGTVSIAASFGNISPFVQIKFLNDNAEVIQYIYHSGMYSNNYTIDGNFIVELVYSDHMYMDNFFSLAWSCNGVRPEIPSLEKTAAPATGVPPTFVPLAACVGSSSPLDASFPPASQPFIKCWSFQCVGTVHISFLNTAMKGTLSLVNSNNYQFTSLTSTHDHYTGSYPANGDMMLMYNDSSAQNHNTAAFTAEWECEDTSVVPPAQGFDSSDYLTLPQEGTYMRLFSERALYKWIIPCIGTLSIAASFGNISPFVQIKFLNDNAEVIQYIYHSGMYSNNYTIDGNFIVELVYSDHMYMDNFFSLAWSCNGVRPEMPSLQKTSAPATGVPPTFVPLAACVGSSSPLNASFPPASQPFTTCWSFQCVGTVHISFLNTAMKGTLSLVNSNNYQLTSLTSTHDHYTGSYPANGDMMLVYNDSSAQNHNTAAFKAEWECEDTSVVPPAQGFDSSDYLTLPQEGTYMRLFSERALYKWIIPCIGTVSIAASFGNISPFVQIKFLNDNAEVIQYIYHSGMYSNNYTIDGNFIVELVYSDHMYMDNFFSLAWSCNGVRPEIPSLQKTSAPVTGVPSTPAPHTALPRTDLPAGATLVPPTSGGVDECATAPCGKGETCLDPDFDVEKNFECRCVGGKEVSLGAPMKECNECMIGLFPCVGPNGERETCTDPDTSPESMGDFVCECPNHGAKRTGGPAQCSTALPSGNPTNLPAGVTVFPPTSAPRSALPSGTATDLPASASPSVATLVPLTPAPDTALPTTDPPAGASLVPPTSAPDTALPTATPTDLPAGASLVPPTSAPDTALPTTDLPAGASLVPPTSAPDTALPTATPTDLPAGATFAPPPPPAVNALCTADKDCRSGRLDPKATCKAGTCVCHTQGYVHPPGVPLCLLADDVTVPMAFAVEYYGVEAQSLWTTATTRESFEGTMSEALGIVTDMRVVVSDGGVLVVGMVRASTAKLADALSGKEDLTAALSSEGVSVSHGVTCASTDASYTLLHNGVCNAVECEGNTTLTLADGTYTCESDTAGSGSNVVLYIGIGVGVFVLCVAACVVALCCQQKGQHAKEHENPLFEIPLGEEAELYPAGKEAEETLQLS